MAKYVPISKNSEIVHETRRTFHMADGTRINKKTGLINQSNWIEDAYIPTFIKFVFIFLVALALFDAIQVGSGGSPRNWTFTGLLNYASSTDWSIPTNWITKITDPLENWDPGVAFKWLKDLIMPLGKFFSFVIFISVGALNIVAFVLQWVAFFFFS